MSHNNPFDSLNILGVSVDVTSLNDAIGYIVSRAGETHMPAGYVIKPYVEFFDQAAAQPDLQDLLNHAELSVADGVAVLWAAHYLYAGPRTFGRFLLTLAQIIIQPNALRWPLPERAAGTNFTWPMLQAAANAHLRVFLIGKESDDGIAATARAIQAAVPGITIVGTRSGRDRTSPRGQVSPEWLEQTAAALHDSRAQLTLVGMGFPLQERVCAHLAAALPHGILVGEGGTFDYESFGGVRRKAPAGIQRLGLEWAWRLALEPRRIIRQLAIPRFIWHIWRSR
jgi:N-acetylglucosaminyldiphosphoundecaprenol N-acetyl-beta-D-mannosaminyltransferase